MSVYAVIGVTFHLLDKSAGPMAWHLDEATFQTRRERPGQSSKSPRTGIARGSPPAKAKVRFEVDEKGAAINIKFEVSTDEEWARAVTEALYQWKFSPGQKGGSPLPVPCTMNFVRGN